MIKRNILTMNNRQQVNSAPSGSMKLQTAIALLGLVLVWSGQPAHGREPRSPEGFTEPVVSIDVAAMESGPISGVFIRRGQRVRKGELLVTLNDEVLRETRAALKAESEGVANIEALAIERNVRQGRYETLKKLQEAGSGSFEEVKLAKADFDVASKRVEAAREQRGIAKLRLRELDARIAQRKIVSPIDGIVVDVKKKRGEYVAAEELHVATIVRLEELRAVFFVPTIIASKMNVLNKERFKIHIPLLNQSVNAKLEYVAPVTEPDSGLVRVHLLIPNSNETYRSGVRCVLIEANHQRTKTAEGKNTAATEWTATARSQTVVTRKQVNQRK